MKSRVFGRLGWKISEIGFGAWAIGGSWGEQKDEASLAALRKALDLGVDFIDTAAGYGDGRSERLIGQVLKERGQRGGGGAIKVATKVPPEYATPTAQWPPFPDERWEDRYSEKYLVAQVEKALKNLNAECIDILQLHTWTRAWNADPQPLMILQKLKKQGKILGIGISTPEQDQNSLIRLMEAGLLDSVQVIYNIFEQEPAAEFLPCALKNKVGVIVRVAFDEGSLTGKFTSETRFAKEDFRSTYFKGDRLQDTIIHVDALRKDIAKVSDGKENDLASVALRFVLKHPACSVVIPGIRSVEQAEKNCRVSEAPPLSDELYTALKAHNWRRAFWY